MQKSCCTRWNRGKYGDPWLTKKKKKKKKKEKEKRKKERKMRKKGEEKNRTRSSTRRKIEISIGLDVTMMLEYSCPNGNAFAGSLHLSVFHDPLHCRYNRSTELVIRRRESRRIFPRELFAGQQIGNCNYIVHYCEGARLIALDTIVGDTYTGCPKSISNDLHEAFYEFGSNVLWKCRGIFRSWYF